MDLRKRLRAVQGRMGLIRFWYVDLKRGFLTSYVFLKPSKSTVTVNPDGKTVKFQVNSGESHAQLGNQSFTYTVGLMPSPGGQPLTANSTAKVEFTSSALSGCQDGRMIGAVPTVTDDRYASEYLPSHKLVNTLP